MFRLHSTKSSLNRLKLTLSKRKLSEINKPEPKKSNGLSTLTLTLIGITITSGIYVGIVKLPENIVTKLISKGFYNNIIEFDKKYIKLSSDKAPAAIVEPKSSKIKKNQLKSATNEAESAKQVSTEKEKNISEEVITKVQEEEIKSIATEENLKIETSNEIKSIFVEEHFKVEASNEIKKESPVVEPIELPNKVIETVESTNAIHETDIVTSNFNVENKSDETVLVSNNASDEIIPLVTSDVNIPIVTSEELAQLNKSENINDTIETLSIYHKTLQKEFEDIILKDIDLIDLKTLKLKYIQLATESFERMKWDNLKLKQIIKQIELEITNKYLDLMLKQRNELELSSKEVIIKKINELTNEKELYEKNLIELYEKKLNNTKQNIEEEYNSKLSNELTNQIKVLEKELNNELNYQIALLRENHIKEQLKLQESIEDISSQLNEYNNVINSIDSTKAISINIHKQSALILALELAVQEGLPIKSLIEKIKNTDSTELTLTALNSIPSNIIENGPPTYQQIKSRFHVARNEARKAALAPENLPPLLGQVFGGILANISYAPKGYVQGEGIEEILSRVDYYIDHNELKKALKEIESIKGLPAVLMNDWIELVKNKLIFDTTIKILKAESSLIHSSFNV